MIYSFIYLRFGMDYGFMHNRELVDGLFQAVNFKMELI